MINSDNLFKAIQIFKNHCLSCGSDDIDVISEEERDKRLGRIINDQLIGQLFSSIKNEPINQINELITTPRLLKIILRKVWNTWQMLHGEIDFDDVLVANVLRFAAPEAFAFLLTHCQEIRGLETDGVSGNRKERKEQLKERWLHSTKNVDWSVGAAEELLTFLFPNWEIEHPKYERNILQGVRHSYPTDYWLRFNLGEIPKSEIRDQDLLHLLRDWKLNIDTAYTMKFPLVESLCNNEDFTKKFEQFAKLYLYGKDLLNIAEELFETILSQDGVKANSNSAPGFFSLWNLSKNIPEEWILRQIATSIPVSLRFSNDIYAYWRDKQIYAGPDEPPRPSLRNQVVEIAKDYLNNSPNKYIEIIDPQIITTTYDFAVRFSVDKGGTGFDPKDWEWLANIIIQAVKINQQIAILQAIPFIFLSGSRTAELTAERDSRIEYYSEFREDLAPKLFGDNLNYLIKSITKDIEIKNLDKDSQEWVKLAQVAAKDWLKSKK